MDFFLNLYEVIPIRVGYRERIKSETQRHAKRTEKLT
jgi:hypothetical protein